MNISDGRLRAALRVKQKKQRDETKWSINGRRRPVSSVAPIRPPQSNAIPWNQRFIFEESIDPGDDNDNNLEALVNNRQPRKKSAVNGKENNVGNKKIDKPSKSTRHYSERADGELVLEFQRCEITPSSHIRLDATSPHIGGTQSVGVSPFDLAKVRATLKADTNQCEVDLDVPEENDHVANTQAHPTHQPIDETTAKAMLDKFEELLYAMEFEEELVHRDITKNQYSQIKTSVAMMVVDDDMDECVHIPKDEVKNSTDEPGELQEQTSLPEDEILEYSQRIKSAIRERKVPLTKNGPLDFHEIVEM